MLIHYPKLHKLANKKPHLAEQKLVQIQQELVANFPQQLDKTNLAKLIVFYELTANIAINSPQSIFVHKVSAKSKLAFGPVWDFDEAFGGSAKQVFFMQGANNSIFNPHSLGGRFFLDLLADEEIKKLVKQEWQKFLQENLAEFNEFMEKYIQLLASSGAFKRDYQRWHKEQAVSKSSPRLSLEEYEQAAYSWLEQRIEFLNHQWSD